MTVYSNSSRDHKLRPYCLVWRRHGSTDSFQHFVVADSLVQAVVRSRTEISFTLANDSVFWELDGNIAHGTSLDVSDHTVNSRTHHKNGLYACLFGASLSLVLILFLTWPRQPEATRPPIDERPTTTNEATLESVTSSTIVGKAPVEILLPGAVLSTSTVNVRAPRQGRFEARDLSVGERVVAGEIIGQYDLSFNPSHCQLQSPNATWPCASEDGIPGDDGSINDSGIVTTPTTGTIFGDMPEKEMEVNVGTLLLQIAQESGLRVRIPARRADIDVRQACDIWKDGSFLSFGEIMRNSSEDQSFLSLRFLDQFAAVIPGMKVVVHCTQR